MEENKESLLPADLKEALEKTKQMTEGTYTVDTPEPVAEIKPVEEAPKDPDPKPADPIIAKDDDAGDDDEGDGEGDGADDHGDDKNVDDEKKRKVVPIKRLMDEKDKRQAAEEKARVAEARVAELEAIANTTPGSKKEIDAITKWAEKHGYEAEGMEELVEIIRSGDKVDRDQIIKSVFGDDASAETLKKMVDTVKLQEEKEFFETQFTEVIPTIKDMYPNATQGQIDKAKKKLDEHGHTKWGVDKDLDYILFKKKEDFDAIFTEAAPAETKQPKVAGPEGGRFGQGGPRGMTADDFKGPNAKPMSELAKLPDAERNKIVEKFDPFQKIAYWNSIDGRTGDTVKRGGQTISKI
jgi:hypothetical protein